MEKRILVQVPADLFAEFRRSDEVEAAPGTFKAVFEEGFEIVFSTTLGCVALEVYESGFFRRDFNIPVAGIRVHLPDSIEFLTPSKSMAARNPRLKELLERSLDLFGTCEDYNVEKMPTFTLPAALLAKEACH